ncbi:type I-F CRISPR-associated protein Csy3 [Halorhodospira neutriphila]|uniref:Type I-F CRISPR-associated protein Csy3 n=1 Tax=Halorhodospira neutriphila TaxID=168379 RepID=A0ABS1E2M6_9GAMM|nr:type I-F CRISPR-associated protein Csy3 [Halorhodospira neutriphila]MBK1726030.1 type I-F CRISPR-associated protein Csy3 [Halorhodospira neutriphila]
MADNAAAELKTASVLAFERKLDLSDALLFAGDWEDRDRADEWPGVAVREKSVRGTISNRLKAKDQDPAKLDAAIETPNLQAVDVAALPSGADTLMARFTLKVLGGVGRPAACNNAAYQERLRAVVDEYVEAQGFAELARRYAHNLANGRFLWRNRLGAEDVEVRISCLEEGKAATTWTFNALEFSLKRFEAPEASQGDLNALADTIRQGLSGERFVLLEICAFARMGAGQEVFPSQELILSRGQRDKSKTLYQVGEIAGIHSQKLGNAIRTIDTWYPAAAEKGVGPIAVEPYGSVTNQGTAYRQPKQKVDFYSLLDNWILKGKKPDLENQHFVVATLIRGGVFGDKVD